MKRINHYSKRVATVSNFLWGAGVVTGSMTCASVIKPYISKTAINSAPVRLAATIGTYLVSLGVGNMAGEVCNDILHVAIDVWNKVTDKVNGDASIPETDDRESDDVRFDDEWYSIRFPGSDAETECRRVFDELVSVLPTAEDSVSLNDLRIIRGKDPIEGGDLVGWNSLALFNSEFETYDDAVILKLPKPKDISDRYITIKEAPKEIPEPEEEAQVKEDETVKEEESVPEKTAEEE